MSERQYKASQAVDAQRKVLSEAIVARQYELQAKLWKAYGTRGQEKSVRDARYHLTYLPDALATSEPTLFAHYVSWVKVLFASLEFPDDFLVTTLECTRDAVQENQPADLSAVAPEFIALGLEHLHQSPATLPTCLEPHGLLGGLARRCLDAQLRVERHLAGRLVLQTVEQDANIKYMYLHVFQRAQCEIGWLWQTNQLSVAKEHYTRGKHPADGTGPVGGYPRHIGHDDPSREGCSCSDRQRAPGTDRQRLCDPGMRISLLGASDDGE